MTLNIELESFPGSLKDLQGILFFFEALLMPASHTSMPQREDRPCQQDVVVITGRIDLVMHLQASLQQLH